jgi:hypothetical protein
MFTTIIRAADVGAYLFWFRHFGLFVLHIGVPCVVIKPSINKATVFWSEEKGCV